MTIDFNLQTVPFINFIPLSVREINGLLSLSLSNIDIWNQFLMFKLQEETVTKQPQLFTQRVLIHRQFI